MNIPLKQPKIRLPKDALARIDIGQSFAEYDLIRTKPEAFIKTPAINAALTLLIPSAFLLDVEVQEKQL